MEALGPPMVFWTDQREVPLTLTQMNALFLPQRPFRDRRQTGASWPSQVGLPPSGKAALPLAMGACICHI